MHHKLPDIYGSIFLSSKGEITEQNWQGRFKVKRILSHSDKFEIKRVYTEIVGRNVPTESEESIKAGALAEVRVRVLEAPGWFYDSGAGMHMVDIKPIYDLLIKCSECEQQWRDDLAKMAGEEVPEEK